MGQDSPLEHGALGGCLLFRSFHEVKANTWDFMPMGLDAEEYGDAERDVVKS
jgi:hypothetical protein